MQRLYAYLDLGDGLHPVTQYTGDVAMLDGISIQWGTESPDTQPDPGVAEFILMDSTGDLAGDFVRLAGARLVIRINDQPQWDTLGDGFGRYDDCRFPWDDLAGMWEPPIQGGRTHVVFDGIISTGGTITRWKHMWRIELSATSRMVVWKRLSAQGPTSTDGRLAGYHWTGSPTDRLSELNRRSAAVGAPKASTVGLTLPPSVAPYDQDTYPTQLELLQRLYAHAPQMPIWHEDVSGDTVTINHTDLAVPAGIALDDQAMPWTTAGGVQRPGIFAGLVETDDEWTLQIMEPWTQRTIKGYRTSDSDGKLAFDDSEATVTATGIPDQLRQAQKTISLDSDAILSSTVGDYPAWSIDDAGRDMVSEWIETLDTMAVPATVVFDSRRIDPYRYPWLYQCQPSGPIYVYGQVAQQLTHADGTPTTSGVWTTIGGTLTYEWRDGDPVVRNSCTLAPIPIDHANALTWDDLAGWPPVYDQVRMTWGQMGLADAIQTTPNTESEDDR